MRVIIFKNGKDPLFRGDAAGAASLIQVWHGTDLVRARRLASEKAIESNQRHWVLIVDGAADPSNSDVPPPNYTVENK